MRRIRVGVALLGVALFATACESKTEQGAADLSQNGSGPRGVLLISIDSLRADHLSCYGYRSPLQPDILTSPNIDSRLAGEGMLFERAISTTSWTVPAHMAMLSGQPDEVHGVQGTSSRLHKSRPLLAQNFKRAGWRTAGFYSGPNLHPYFGFGRGFESYIDCTSMGVDASHFGPSSPREKTELREMEAASHRGHTGGNLVKQFESWFDGLGADERFFAFVHFWDVHYDYEPPAEYDLFDPDYKGEIGGSDIPDLAAVRLPDPVRDAQHVAALYDGEILFTDANVSRLLDALEASNRLEDTLVVFVADHGEEFADHGRFGHNKTLYEEVVHVPLIVRYPELVSAAARNDSLVSLVDLAPTILDFCGLPPDQTHWGRSLVPLLRETGELPPRSAPMELIFGRPIPGRKREPMQAVHAGDHKVVRNRPGEIPIVFDLLEDPKERAALDVPKSDPRLRAARKLWREIENSAVGLPRDQGELPTDLADELRDIGYLGQD